jgi:transcriptional regulator with XRE-family HTH domain
MDVTCPHDRRCPCGRLIEQKTNGKGGRKRVYCDAQCRRRFERERERQRRDQAKGGTIDRWALPLAQEVHGLADELAAAEHRRDDLPKRLRLADRLQLAVEHFIAAAVHDARQDKAAWGQVAEAAGVSVEVARTRWSQSRVEAVLTRQRRRSPRRSTSTRMSGPADVLPGHQSPLLALASALTCQFRASGLTMADVARKVGVSPSFVSRILTGEREPSWPVVHTLTTVLGGRPQELRHLWECLHMPTPAGRDPLDQALQQFQDAIHGLHLAAYKQPLSRVCQRAAPPLELEAVEQIMRGDVVPDWPTAAALATALGGSAAHLRPLWDSVHYAVLASRYELPAPGLPIKALPVPEQPPDRHP